MSGLSVHGRKLGNLPAVHPEGKTRLGRCANDFVPHKHPSGVMVASVKMYSCDLLDFAGWLKLMFSKKTTEM